MIFLLATHNTKKRTELSRILAPLGIDVQTADEAGIDLTDVEETGSTFEENARLKAQSGCRESGMPCVADDSGLAVDALGGAPGIYSARYAGDHGNDERNMDKLLAALADLPMPERTAKFVCTVCCVFPDGPEILTRGECPGHIAFSRSGSGGFGYDPIFLPDERDGLSMAALSDTQKDAISHRRRALEKLAHALKERGLAR